MPDRLIDEPRLKEFISSVEKIVSSDGIKENFVLPSETKDLVIEDAVREISSNIASFDDWYFDSEDERTSRLTGLKDISKDHQDLADTVQEVVDFNLASLRAVGDLDQEPDIEHLVDQLVSYIVNWQDWYYEYKQEQNRFNWYEDSGLTEDIYLFTDYGDEDKSEGRGNLYDENDAP